MITAIIDQGWGSEHPTKQMEKEIVDRYLRPYHMDDSRTVVINSTWYDDDLHRRLHDRFAGDVPDRLILVSMLDSAIVRAEQWQDLGCEIRQIGYYAGPDWIDFWSLVVDRYMRLPGVNLLDETRIDTPFMCLNRKPHWHRQRLYNHLQSADLLGKGLVSMGGEQGLARRLLAKDSGGSDLAPNGGTSQHGIANDIMTLGHAENWQRHLLNVVTETQFDVSTTTFVTEKTWKPVLGLRPFVIYAADGGRRWLQDHGFQDYANDFGDICDLDLTCASNMAPFLQVLAAQSIAYWRQKFLDLRGKIAYNRTQFDRHVAQQWDKINQGIQCPISCP